MCRLSFFEDVGNVIDIRMAKNADGSMKGFCHVTFATAAAAVKVVKMHIRFGNSCVALLTSHLLTNSPAY